MPSQMTVSEPGQMERVIAALAYPVGALFGPFPPMLVLVALLVAGRSSRFVQAHLLQGAVRVVWLIVAAVLGGVFVLAGGAVGFIIDPPTHLNAPAPPITQVSSVVGGVLILLAYVGLTLGSLVCAFRAARGELFRVFLFGRLIVRAP